MAAYSYDRIIRNQKTGEVRKEYREKPTPVLSVPGATAVTWDAEIGRWVSA